MLWQFSLQLKKTTDLREFVVVIVASEQCARQRILFGYDVHGMTGSQITEHKIVGCEDADNAVFGTKVLYLQRDKLHRIGNGDIRFHLGFQVIFDVFENTVSEAMSTRVWGIAGDEATPWG